jgi:hypothetical protein
MVVEECVVARAWAPFPISRRAEPEGIWGARGRRTPWSRLYVRSEPGSLFRPLGYDYHQLKLEIK